MPNLLATGSTAFERAAAEACADAMELGVPLRQLWNPDLCPLPFLPYLAWAYSVDYWDEAWSEATKRAAVRASWFVHKHKGTIGALRRVVEPLGYLIEVEEWWETEPPGTPGTFAVRIGVLDTGITDAMYQEMERLIADAKPLSRHIVGLAIAVDSPGMVFYGAAAHLGEELTIYPYTPEEIEVTGQTGTFGASHIIDTMSVYPS